MSKLINIEIDADAGFCFGVKRAIELAEHEIAQNGSLACLGQMVHNQNEVERLEKMGLETIGVDEFKKMNGQKVLFRAHGEAPQRYELARKNNLQIVDATCPIVLNLQKKIAQLAQNDINNELQLIIFGKKNHPEVVGLEGNAFGKSIVVTTETDISKIDFTKKLVILSQTTQSRTHFEEIVGLLRQQMQERSLPAKQLKILESGCKQVANRDKNLRLFALKHDIIIFVSGVNSSNGNYLYSVCKQINQKSYFVSSVADVQEQWFDSADSIGITGATSTPPWQLTTMRDKLMQMFS